MIYRINRFDKDEVDKFYSTKYETYKKLATRTVCSMIVGSAVFLLVDCIMCNRLIVENIIPRCIMLIFLVPYMILMKQHGYKTNILLSYVMMYAVGACSIIAVTNLPANDRAYICDAFLVMQVAFMGFELSVPKYWAQVGHMGLILELMLAKLTIPEINVNLTLLIQIMAFIMIEYIIHILEEKMIDNYSSSEEIENRMIHDQLTKAFNRNKIQDLCIGATDELEMNRACFLMLDIDFFKKINDTYGHETGDVVLQNLVAIARNYIRKRDYIIRWGGEEFIIILPDCGEIKAKEIAETIREQVILNGDNMCNATISVGIAPYLGGDYHDTIKKADTALYYAKEHGRNQVVLQSELSK